MLKHTGSFFFTVALRCYSLHIAWAATDGNGWQYYLATREKNNDSMVETLSEKKNQTLPYCCCS